MSDSNSFLRVVRFVPAGMSVLDFADACRRAARTLLEGRSWGKRELAAWLLLEYAPLAASEKRRAKDAPMTGLVTERQVEELLTRTRRAVRAAMTDTVVDAAPDWIDEAIASGWVARAIDEWGESAYVPVAKPSMRLTSRVLSLLAADHLSRHETETEQRVSSTRIAVAPRARPALGAIGS